MKELQGDGKRVRIAYAVFPVRIQAAFDLSLYFVIFVIKQKSCGTKNVVA